MYLYLVLVKHDIILRVSQHGDKLWGRWVAVSIGQGRKQALVWREGRTAVQGHGEVLLGAEIHWMVTLIHAVHVVYSLQALQTMQVAVTEGTAQHPASITQSWAERGVGGEGGGERGEGRGERGEGGGERGEGRGEEEREGGRGKEENEKHCMTLFVGGAEKGVIC